MGIIVEATVPHLSWKFQHLLTRNKDLKTIWRSVFVVCLLAIFVNANSACSFPPGVFDGMIVSVDTPMPWYGERCDVSVPGQGYYVQIISYTCLRSYCCSRNCTCDSPTTYLDNPCIATSSSVIECSGLHSTTNYSIYDCCGGYAAVDQTCVQILCKNSSTPTLNTTAAYCDDVCLTNSTTGENYCMCSNPTQILVNRTKCVDTCASAPDLCSDICTNTSNGYICSCNETRTLSSDNRTCTGPRSSITTSLVLATDSPTTTSTLSPTTAPPSLSTAELIGIIVGSLLLLITLLLFLHFFFLFVNRRR